MQPTSRSPRRRRSGRWRRLAVLAGLILPLACAPRAPTAAPAGGGAAPSQPAAPTAPAPGPAAGTAEPERIVITISDPTITFGPLYVGIGKGFYREEGLDVQVELVRPDASLAALATGQNVDYQATLGTVARGAGKGLPVKAVGVWFEKIVFFLMARPEIRTFADLKGQILGVTTYAGTIDLTLRQTLRDAGYDPETDVTIVQLGAGTGRVAAIAQGAAVASLFNPPDNLLAEQQGLHRIPSTAEAVPLPFTGIGTSDRKLREQPSQVERLLRASLRTLRFMREQPDEASDLIAAALSADPELNRRAYASLVDTISPDGWASPEALDGQLRESAEPGAPPPPAAQVYDAGPLKAAQQALGIAGRP
jgi:NitT/TauT family transport system substrate-binding protein